MLISEEYRTLQARLHRDPGYGMASVQYAPMIADFIRARGVRRLLDYGSGKGRLSEELQWLVPWELAVQRYDPGIPEFSAAPEPCDYVVCIDVLEHIEPPLLSNVLDDLRRVTRRTGLFTVHTGPAVKTLADGRNAHLIQEPPSWWLPQLLSRFELLQFNALAYGFCVVVASLDNASATASKTGGHSA